MKGNKQDIFDYVKSSNLSGPQKSWSRLKPGRTGHITRWEEPHGGPWDFAANFLGPLKGSQSALIETTGIRKAMKEVPAKAHKLGVTFFYNINLCIILNSISIFSYSQNFIVSIFLSKRYFRKLESTKSNIN
jgi:hypothetical protein